MTSSHSVTGRSSSSWRKARSHLKHHTSFRMRGRLRSGMPSPCHPRPRGRRHRARPSPERGIRIWSSCGSIYVRCRSSWKHDASVVLVGCTNRRRTHSRSLVGWSVVSPVRYIDGIVDETVLLRRQVRTIRSVQKVVKVCRNGERHERCVLISSMSGLAPHDQVASTQLVHVSAGKP